MTDETTAALQALIKQVETLTTTVTDQQKRMDGLYEHNSRLLDQIKDGKRDNTPAKKSIVDIVQEEQHERKMQEAGFQRAADGNWYPKGVRPAHSLTREEARDPVKYREAKAAAEKAGTNLTIFNDGNGDPTTRNIGQPRTVAKLHTITLDDEHNRVRYVRADHETGNGLIQRRLRAESEGYTTRTFREPGDLPEHMQTKLRLMENAANASDT